MILLAEDNNSIATLYAEVLAEAGYVVEIARTGTEALAQLIKGGFRLAIIDLSLPEMNGAEVAIAAHARGIRVPMLAVSGAAALVDPHKLAEAGFSGPAVTKPVRLTAFVDLVRQHAGPPNAGETSQA